MSESIKNIEEQIEHKVRAEVEHTLDNMEKSDKSVLKNKWVRTGGIIALVMVVCGGLLYWQYSSTRVAIDTSLISAPLITLSPTAAGQLQQIYVHEGDMVAANAPVAEVGTQIIKTQVAGEIVSVENNIGKNVNPGEAVVMMIDPSQLRVVGTIDENKGLDRIHVGQSASFTVDAFGGRQFYGVVDEVSPTSNQSDVVFNISDQRQTQQFDIKVRFDQQAYSELKNGMSAKLTVYTK